MAADTIAAASATNAQFVPPPSKSIFNPPIDDCLHHVILQGSCLHCGAAPISAGYYPTIPLRYVCPGLEVSIPEMLRLCSVEHEKLIRTKRLCLVLDIDGTLLHTVYKHKLLPSETHLWDKAADGQTADLFQMHHLQPLRLTKLRPGVREFLREASTMFHMYLYTKGSASYANAVAQILDPGEDYFKARVIAREDMRGRAEKRLDLVVAPENVVVILDDTQAVWPDHQRNLILADKYNYFTGTSGASPSMAESGEDEVHLFLMEVLAKLMRVYCEFFGMMGPNQDPMDRDVREVLSNL